MAMTPPEEAGPDTGDSLRGKVIAGNFRIERLIGSGAMGNVYQAEQLSLGKEVAVKVLHPHLSSDEKLVRRFQREAKSASRLNHANSIQIIDSGRDGDGTLYIAMELLSGRDLSQVIKDEFPLPVPRIVRIMSQVLSALDEAHAHGVIHRDLKPSNIMLIERRGEPDFVKVCDYGIAKAQHDESAAESQMLTIQGLVCGTPEYMSPEQARGEPLDGRTDLYSAAVILYHMVTGDIPFRAATPIGIVSRHLSEAPVVPSSRRPDPSIPPDLDDLILRGLAKSRELRPETAARFREELENIGSGRLGRRLRDDQGTVPATPKALAGDGETMAMAAVMKPDRGGKRAPAGKPLAVGLMMVAIAGAGTMVMLKRARQPGGGGQASLVSASAAGAIGAIELSGQDPSVSAPAAEPPANQNSAPKVAAAVPPAGSQEPANSLSDIDSSTATNTSSEVAAALPRAAGTADPVVSRRFRSHGGATPSHPALLAADVAPKRQPVAAATSTRGSMKSTTPRMIDSTAGSATAPHPGSLVAAAVTAPPPPGGAAAPDAVQGSGSAGGNSPREIVTDGERLLSQGEVIEACRRGEDAKKAAPRLAPAYKFLGKCYMRAGNPTRAKENYRRYLELAPGAPDAMFIESIVK
ncbi:MAG: protein kinase [Myxococcales bacterium]